MAQKLSVFEQYKQIKSQHSSSVLLFQIGDFFEMFAEDAVLVSKELGLTLTSRGSGKNKVEMCGVPSKSLQVYVEKLVAKGIKVAICEQKSIGQNGLLTREVTQIITPGTVTDLAVLDNSSNNYIASITKNGLSGAVVFLDISTGDFFGYDIENNFDEQAIGLLIKYNPKEVLGNNQAVLLNQNKALISAQIPYIEEYFAKEKSDLLYKIREKNLENIENACNNVFAYCKYTQRKNMPNIRDLAIYKIGNFLQIDAKTKKNLELCKNISSGKKTGSLLDVLDECQTSMGSRKLEQYINQPLTDLKEILIRQNIVAYFMNKEEILAKTREMLAQIPDIERICSRINSNQFYIKNAWQVCLGLKNVLKLKDNLKDSECLKFFSNLDGIEKLVYKIENAVYQNENGELKLNENVSQELFTVEVSLKKLQEKISVLESIEKEKTKVENLKINCSELYGYSIEIPKSQIKNIPFSYIKKQSTIYCERFTTDELKELEDEIFALSDQKESITQGIFSNLKDEISKQMPLIFDLCEVVKKIDVLSNFAYISKKFNFTKPEFCNENCLIVENGKHPVINKFVKNFTENSTNMNINCTLMLITGANMGGKSTYMRQNAIIILLAQMGCFVPATKAKLGVFKAIFSRIGASDDITSGASTFMVEMNEVSEILNNANQNSFVVLDEVGRGTNTSDGIAIASAVIENLINKKCLTMFATHFVELTKLDKKFKTLKNFCAQILEKNGNIIFTHKIVDGISERSYGLEVAKMANFPTDVLESAKKYLSQRG